MAAVLARVVPEALKEGVMGAEEAAVLAWSCARMLATSPSARPIMEDWYLDVALWVGGVIGFVCLAVVDGACDVVILN